MKQKIDKKKVITLIIILLAIVLIFFFTRPKDCSSDDNCFNTAALSCSKAEVDTFNNGNNYIYEILGKKDNNCIIEVSLVSLSETQPPSIRQALEGRSMKCAVPRETFQNKTIKEIENLSDYCTGPLKEATLQITVDELYDIIVKNIGPLTSHFEQRLTIS